VTLWPAVEKL